MSDAPLAVSSLSVKADGSTANTASIVNEALKEHYKPDRVREMTYKDNPLLAIMPKYERFGGENMPIPLILANPQRRSANFKSAQDNTSVSTVKQFLLTRIRDYSFAVIEHEAIQASQNNADAFVRYATMEIDGAMNSLTRSLAIAMYRDGSGSLGVLSTDPLNTKVLTLTNPQNISNFEVGMELNVASSATAAIRSNFTSAGSSAIVEGVDRDLGKISITVACHNDVASGDHLFQKGDAHGGASFKKVRGLEGWLPSSAPTLGADDFFGVDRGVDPTRLGGIRVDGSSLPIEEALITAASRVAREGGTPSHVFMDYDSYANLEKALGSKVNYARVQSADAEIGFDTLTLQGPKGRMSIVPDHNCIPNVAFMLQMDTWSLNTLGQAPQVLQADGQNMLRVSNLDAYEVRMGYYGNMACTAPGYNARIALA